MSTRASKRKRAVVSYYEGDSEDAENEPHRLKVKKTHSSTKTTNTPTKKPLGFMDLSGEIRNMIYELALTDSEGIHLRGGKSECRRIVEREDPGALDNENLDTNGNPIDSRRQGAVQFWCYRRPEKSRAYEKLGAGLLATNKQIYNEALGYLYNRNEFFFQDPFALHTFIVNIGHRLAPLLKDITIVNWITSGAFKPYSHCCFTALLLAPNLESLKILGNLNVAWNGDGPTGIARQVYENAFPWIEAVGAAKGKYDAALDILHIAPFNFTYKIEYPKTWDEAKNTEKFQDELRKYLNRHTGRFHQGTSKKSSC